jgi:hypothetical protein
MPIQPPVGGPSYREQASPAFKGISYYVILGLGVKMSNRVRDNSFSIYIKHIAYSKC